MKVFPPSETVGAEAIARAQGKTKSELVREALRRQVQLEHLRESSATGAAAPRSAASAPRTPRRSSTSFAAGKPEAPRPLRHQRPRLGADRRRAAEPRLLEEAIDGRIELALPDLVLDELERVLTEKLGFGEEQSRAARALLAQLATERQGRPSAPTRSRETRQTMRSWPARSKRKSTCSRTVTGSTCSQAASTAA